MKRRRNLGMSIVELVVSGSIMLMVAGLTFQTMIFSTKLSAQTVDSDSMVNDGRFAITQLQEDIRKADTVLTDFNYGGVTGKSIGNQIVLRQPLVGADGQRTDATGLRVVVYRTTLASSLAPSGLVRDEIVLDASWGIKSKTSKVLATNIRTLSLNYYLKTALPVSGSTVSLPGALANSTPTGSQLFLFDMVAPWANIDLHKSTGFTQSDLASQGYTNTSLQIDLGTTAPAGATTDFNFKVDPSYQAKSDKSNWSNYVTATLTFRKRISGGRTKTVQFDVASQMENKQ